MTAERAGTGAVPVSALDESDVDASLVAHYGDPMREQRTLATSTGLVDRTNRAIVRITGPDRLAWLHDLTSQHLRDLAPMTGTELLLLSPHGHVEHHAVGLDDGETMWLDTEPGNGPALVDFLTRMRFLTRVEVAEVSPQWAVLSLVGPESVEAATRVGVTGLEEPAVLPVPGPKFRAGSVPAGPTSRYPAARIEGIGYARRMRYGVDLLVTRTDVAKLADALAVPWAGIWAYEALRVAHRVPRLGRDTDHRTLPAEVGWLATAVHLEKGCYRGQETVARVHNLGRPPRRLVLLHLDGITTDELPAAGSPVRTADGREVGFVGTAVRHYELGMIALAVLKRNVADDAQLVVGASAAAIEPETDPPLDPAAV